MYKRNYKVSISNYPYCCEHVEVNELAQDLELPADDKKQCVVYIHIPFCAQICDFCIYCHEQATNKEIIEQYTQMIIMEISMYGEKAYVKGLSVMALYFGGGTPSMLSPEQFQRILTACKEALNCIPECEISVEINVQSATEKKIEQYKKAGVKRISAGIQTFSESTREILGLPFKEKYLRDWFSMVNQYDMPVLSMDVMYGSPFQKVEEVSDDIEIATGLGISHISLYQLCVIPGTKLFYNINENGWKLPDDDVLYRMFGEADVKLRKKGFHNTVIPEYSLQGKESVFWKENFNPAFERLSFGASAYGYLKGRTYQNSSSISTYKEMITNGVLPYDSISEKVSELQKLERSIIFQSRKQVIDTKALRENYGGLYSEMYEGRLKKLVDGNLSYMVNDKIKLTLPGMYQQEDIVTEFMESFFCGKSKLYKKMVIGNQKVK